MYQCPDKLHNLIPASSRVVKLYGTLPFARVRYDNCYLWQLQGRCWILCIRLALHAQWTLWYACTYCWFLVFPDSRDVSGLMRFVQLHFLFPSGLLDFVGFLALSVRFVFVKSEWLLFHHHECRWTDTTKHLIFKM